MPNEQTSVPLFTSGEVLTAANMNLSAGTGVPVFTNTTTRDAAFGGAGEKVLAEGQLCYLSSTNVVQYYDGAAWATVGPASAGGLTLIATSSPSAQGSVSFNSVFSATYDNYLIVMRLARSATGDINIRYRASGTDATGANYNTQHLYGSSGTAGANNTTAQTTASIVGSAGGADNSTTTLTISSPAIATPTNSTNLSSYLNGQVIYANSTYHSLSTAYDGITIYPASGTITGTIRIYGYANS